MKKPLLIILATIITISLVGCTSGVSQNEYDKIVEENESLKKQATSSDIVEPEPAVKPTETTKLDKEQELENISYSVPSNWKITDVAENKGFYYYPYEENADGLLYVAFEKVPTSVIDTTEEQLLSVYLSNVIESVESDGGELIDKKEIEIKGQIGTQANYYQIIDATKYHSNIYTFIYLDTYYSFAFCEPNVLSDDFKSIAEQVLETIELIEESAPISSKETSKPVESKPVAPPAPVSSKESPPPPPAPVSSKESPPPAPAQEPAQSVSIGDSNALSKANTYLSIMAFSHSGLIEQLEHEDFTNAQATYGANNCGADWNEQASKQAKTYLGIMAFSHSGLIEQLEHEDFTNAQATFGVSGCGADWNEQASKQAKAYLDIMSFSRQGLIDQLISEGYTTEQATYGVGQNGY